MKLRVFCIALLFCYSLLFSVGQANMRQPYMHKKRQQQEPHPSSLPVMASHTALLFFRHVISPLDGARSPSYPTGSAYSIAAIAQYGAFWGIVMTGDRLFHEADISLNKSIYLYGVKRYYDPPYANAFWRTTQTLAK